MSATTLRHPWQGDRFQGGRPTATPPCPRREPAERDVSHEARWLGKSAFAHRRASRSDLRAVQGASATLPLQSRYSGRTARCFPEAQTRLGGFRAQAGFLSAPQLHLPGIGSGATGVPFILNLMNY
jgi:hypothetical protein